VHGRNFVASGSGVNRHGAILGMQNAVQQKRPFGHLASFQLSFPDVQLHIVDAPLGAGPESILTIVVMDSGLARFAPAPE
jgi:hypothetical protein